MWNEENPVNSRVPIYLDYGATTPVDARVLEVILPYFTHHIGNAASRDHAFGWDAKAAVERARVEVADLIHAAPEEIIFTSGATESLNLAIKGLALGSPNHRRRIVASAVEHQAVLDVLDFLRTAGWEVVYLPVSRNNALDLDQLEESLTADTALLAVMYANNEIGTVYPISEIGNIARSRNIPFVCDAAQAVGKISVNVGRDQVDMLAFSAHKMYGPKGVGVLFVRADRNFVLVPQLHGGGHEQGLRSGTLNSPGIVGLGVACRLAGLEMEEEHQRMRDMREVLETRILSNLTGVYVNGVKSHRLSTISNLCFEGVHNHDLVAAIRDLAISTGAACSGSRTGPSHVLLAMGIEDELAQSSVRISIGRFTTFEEIEYATDVLVSTVKRLRNH